MDRKAFAACTEAICSNLHQTAVLYFDSEAADESLCHVVCRICRSLTAITAFSSRYVAHTANRAVLMIGRRRFGRAKLSSRTSQKGSVLRFCSKFIIEQNYCFVQSRGGERRKFAEKALPRCAAGLVKSCVIDYASGSNNTNNSLLHTGRIARCMHSLFANKRNLRNLLLWLSENGCCQCKMLCMDTARASKARAVLIM